MIENVRIARRGLDIRMVERLLHQLQIAGLAQELGREIVPEVVETEAGDARTLAQIAPVAFHAVVAERIASPLVLAPRLR